METKNMIQLDNGIRLLKSHLTMKFNGEIIKGISLIGRLDSRIKKTRSKL